MNKAKFTCPFCGDELPLLQSFKHIPECLSRTASDCGIQIRCWCNGSGVAGYGAPQPPSPVPHITINHNHNRQQPAPSVTIPPTTPTTQTIIHSTTVPDRTQLLTGKACISCGRRRTPSQVLTPFIYIGRYRVVVVCRQGHWNDDVEATQIEAFIQQEMDEITEAGDHPVSHDEEDTNTDTDKERICEGITFRRPPALKDSTLLDRAPVCSARGNHLLCIMEGETKHYFCCPKHLRTYLQNFVFHRTKKARTSDEAGRHPPNKKSKTSDSLMETRSPDANQMTSMEDPRDINEDTPDRDTPVQFRVEHKEL
ncbi:hypothetical protein PROFUN_00553 [Planoprotostelium fungivorum]|uniref:Uncharacterized protein n=1 Tax=Planoprotostelium fungivorum TaxID=1890364 RepID=A0A2P6N149_9EUKA|nr:hypothetical protein PROFUN_00553 [Planoprotostelium fungivorum]